MASLQRINCNNSMTKALILGCLMAVVASSQQKSVEEATSLKPNSWIIQSPVKRPLPGLSGIGLPPGGVLLMTMDPNATMADTQPQPQQQSLESTTTAVPSVSLTDRTTIEPISVTQVSIVSQSPITSADVEEVAFTDTLSISTGGTVAITEESNSSTLELESVTQQSLSADIQSSTSHPTPTTERVTDAADVFPLITQDFDGTSLMEALKVDSESGQTSDESIELTTVAEADVGEDGYFHPELVNVTTEKPEATEEYQTNVSVDVLPDETYLTTENSLSNEDLTTKDSATTEISYPYIILNATQLSPHFEIVTIENSLSNEDLTTTESATTETSETLILIGNVTHVSGDAYPDETDLTTTTDLTTGSGLKEEENVTAEVAATLAEDSSTEHSISPIPPKGPAPLPELIADDESDLGHTEKDLTVQTTEAAIANDFIAEDDATTEVELTGGPSVLLASLTQSEWSAESDETSVDAGSGAVLSTEANDELNDQSGSGANPDNGSDAPPDVVADDSGSVDLDTTIDSTTLETESPSASDVAKTEAQQFLVFTTDAAPEDPGLAESVTEMENIELDLKKNPEKSNLVASAATAIKNAGNSRNLLSEENAKEEVDVTKAAVEVVEADIKSGDAEARQYSRPYPIRHGMRPGMRPGFRPSIDRHDQNFRPEYDDYNFNVISRTYDYCYTLWCKFKTTLSRIGLL